MDRYEFRGLRADGKGWVYGDYFNGCKIVTTSVSNEGVYSEKGSDRIKYTYHEVNPETVGQYTGKQTESGVKIFEGDRVRWGDASGLGPGIGLVTWCPTQHAYTVYIDEYDEHLLYAVDYAKIEVIGNIHESNESNLQ